MTAAVQLRLHCRRIRRTRKFADSETVTQDEAHFALCCSGRREPRRRRDRRRDNPAAQGCCDEVTRRHMKAGAGDFLAGDIVSPDEHDEVKSASVCANQKEAHSPVHSRFNEFGYMKMSKRYLPRFANSRIVCVSQRSDVARSPNASVAELQTRGLLDICAADRTATKLTASRLGAQGCVG